MNRNQARIDELSAEIERLRIEGETSEPEPENDSETNETIDRAYAIATGRNPAKTDWITQRRTMI